MSESRDERRTRVMAHLPNGFENQVGHMTSDQTLAACVHLIENLTTDHVLEALIVSLDGDDREELEEALHDTPSTA